MKKLLLCAALVGCRMYAEDAAVDTEAQAPLAAQFRDALLAQSPDLAAIYADLTNDRKAEFDTVCGKFVALNQQAFQVLNPAYTALFTAMQEITGFVDWKIVLMFAGNQLTQNVQAPFDEQDN